MIDTLGVCLEFDGFAMVFNEMVEGGIEIHQDQLRKERHVTGIFQRLVLPFLTNVLFLS